MTVTVNKNVHNVHIWSPCTIFMQINNKIENIMKITTRKKECFLNYLNMSKITFKLNLRLCTRGVLQRYEIFKSCFNWNTLRSLVSTLQIYFYVD